MSSDYKLCYVDIDPYGRSLNVIILQTAIVVGLWMSSKLDQISEERDFIWNLNEKLRE